MGEGAQAGEKQGVGKDTIVFLILLKLMWIFFFSVQTDFIEITPFTVITS